MRIYYKKKFWAGVGALLLGLALPGTQTFLLQNMEHQLGSY